MKLEISVGKKHAYYLIGLIVLVFIIGIAIAQTSAPNPGHAAAEIGEGTIANTLTLSEGNIGIGANKHIYLGSKQFVRLDNTNNIFFGTGTGGAYYFFGDAMVDYGSVNTGSLAVNGGLIVTGNVGIGTPSPAYTLEVETAGTTSFGLMSGTGITGIVIKNTINGLTTFDNQNGEIMQMQLDRDVAFTGGNVGIGTTGPIGLLDLSGQTSSDIVFSDKQWWGGVSNPRGRIYSAIDSDQWAGSRLTLQSVVGSGSSYSFIDTISLKNGNVGIGTTNPTATLDIAGNKGTTDNRNFRVTYPGGGNLLNAEFSALTHVLSSAGGNGWTALYAKQGSASKAGTFDGDVAINGNIIIPQGNHIFLGSKHFVRLDSTTNNVYFGTGTGGNYYFYGNVMSGYGEVNMGSLNVNGNLNVAGGTKNFVQDHPADPSKEIIYTSIEAGDVRTLLTGSAKLNNGEAVINLPEHFSLVTNSKGITALAASTEESNGLYISYKDNKKLVVKELNNGKSNAAFDYIITGIRIGYENKEIISSKESDQK